MEKKKLYLLKGDGSLGYLCTNFIYPGQSGEKMRSCPDGTKRISVLKLAPSWTWATSPALILWYMIYSSQQLEIEPLFFFENSNLLGFVWQDDARVSDNCLVIDLYRSLKWMAVLHRDHAISEISAKKSKQNMVIITASNPRIVRDNVTWGTWLAVCAFLGAVSGCSSPRYCSHAPYMFL
jgi:hypothetical protein